MFCLFGHGVMNGIAIGKAYVLENDALRVEHYFIQAEQIADEIQRLEDALALAQSELKHLKQNLNDDAPEEMAAFLDVHLLILQDTMIVQAPKKLIRERLYNAKWAISHQTELLMAEFENMPDAYLRERKYDIQQVGEKILKAFSKGHAQTQADIALNNHTIIVAYDISPSDMLTFRRQLCAGFISDCGGKNSHTAILARSMNIPAIVGSALATELIRHDDCLIIDGQQGVVIVSPSQAIIEEYRWRAQEQLHQRKRLERLRYIPTQTMDGVPIQLMANIELPDDCTQVARSGLDGVGLFRSEWIFLDQAKLPDEDTQFAAYYNATQILEDLPITIRTIDIGADKQLDAIDTSTSPLGLRAIRWSLAEPEMFQTQLRAILRASHFGKVSILIPMISHVEEIRAVRHHLNKVKQDLTQQNILFDANILVGMMVEIPAAAFALPMFFPYVDFISIGTNDLIQYMLAVDRTDSQVSYLYNPQHPAIIHTLAHIIQMAQLAQKPVAICGELAGDPHMTKLLLGFGLRCFSMHPQQFLAVKSHILHSDVHELKQKAFDILQTYDADKIKQLIQDL